MKTPVQELMEHMEQNQYFIGNDLFLKYKELLQKEQHSLGILLNFVLKRYSTVCEDGMFYFVNAKKEEVFISEILDDFNNHQV